MFLAEGLTAIGAAIAAGLSGLGAAIGIGMSVSRAMDAISRQPEADKKIRSSLMIGLAFSETIAIYGVLIAILLITM